MRLDYLCDVEWSYREETAIGGAFVRLRPYGSEEGVGFGVLVGTVSGGTLHGSLTCVNHPRVRSGGVFYPDIHGVLQADDGAGPERPCPGQRPGRDGTQAGHLPHDTGTPPQLGW